MLAARVDHRGQVVKTLAGSEPNAHLDTNKQMFSKSGERTPVTRITAYPIQDGHKGTCKDVQ
jgi:hypothetical protein